jgi:hypothetical protein
MPRRVGNIKVKTSTLIDEGIRYRWEKQFGRYASLSWLLETAMEGLLEAAKTTPSLEEQVKQAVLAHLSKYTYHPEQPNAERATPNPS